MFIDWHTNLSLPEHYTDGGEFHTRVGVNISDSPESHRQHVANATDKFVIVTMNFERLNIRVPNEFVAEYGAQFDGRAKMLACVDPLSSDAAAQLESAIKELGMSGLKMSPVYGGYHPWCSQAWKLYEVCDRLSIPILWHQSAAYATDSTLEYANPVLLDRVARAFPRLRMIIAHVGQPWVAETVVLLRKHPHLLADLSARFHRKWQLHNALMLAMDYGVTKQLLFGSDFPLRTPLAALAEFKDINNWGADVRLPKIPDELIDDIVHNRPLSSLWPED